MTSFQGKLQFRFLQIMQILSKKSIKKFEMKSKNNKKSVNIMIGICFPK